jgi:hypothetical protein
VSAERERADLKANHPAAFREGMRLGLGLTLKAEREPGGYPKGFHGWPLEKRNAWFAGFNIGRIEHARRVAQPPDEDFSALIESKKVS